MRYGPEKLRQTTKCQILIPTGPINIYVKFQQNRMKIATVRVATDIQTGQWDRQKCEKPGKTF